MKSSAAAQNRRRIREGHLTPEQLQDVFAACERVRTRCGRKRGGPWVSESK